MDRFKKVYSQGVISVIEIWNRGKLCVSQGRKCRRAYAAA